MDSIVQFAGTIQFKSQKYIDEMRRQIHKRAEELNELMEEAERNRNRDAYDEYREECNNTLAGEDLIMGQYRLADPKVKDVYPATTAWKNAFIDLMVEYYDDQQVVVETNTCEEEEEAGEASLSQLIIRDFKVGDSSLYVSKAQMNEWRLGQGNISAKKLAEQLKSMGFTEGQCRNKGGRFWGGLQKKEKKSEEVPPGCDFNGEEKQQKK